MEQINGQIIDMVILAITFLFLTLWLLIIVFAHHYYIREKGFQMFELEEYKEKTKNQLNRDA
jgi:hypothetical protein